MLMTIATCKVNTTDFFSSFFRPWPGPVKSKHSGPLKSAFGAIKIEAFRGTKRTSSESHSIEVTSNRSKIRQLLNRRPMENTCKKHLKLHCRWPWCCQCHWCWSHAFASDFSSSCSPRSDHWGQGTSRSAQGATNASCRNAQRCSWACSPFEPMSASSNSICGNDHSHDTDSGACRGPPWVAGISSQTPQKSPGRKNPKLAGLGFQK